MCGILVRIGKTPCSSDALTNALNKLQHRGPDASAIKTYNIDGITYDFMHTRLSIRGLSSSANQPLISNCGRYILCFNGEIFNTSFLAQKFNLPRELLYSDSVVLLSLLSIYGAEILSYLEGMFAFIFSDISTGETIVSRDSIGVKPLYKYETDSVLIYSSEIAPIKPLIDERIAINRMDLIEFLALGFVSEPYTGFSNVVKVEASSCHKILKGKHVSSEIFTPLPSTNVDTSELISNSIKQQVVSDVPIGVFFSGGIDSTVLAVETGLPLFHLHANPLDKKFAGRIADSLNRALNIVSLDSNPKSDFFSDARFIAESIEEPISDYTFKASYNLAKAANKKGFKVMLSGMGADEAFGGYPRYRVFTYYLRLRGILKYVPRLIINFVSRLRLFSGRRSQRLITAFSTDNPFWAYASLVGYLSRAELSVLLKVDDLTKLNTLDQRWRRLTNSISDYTDLPKAMDKNGYLAHNLTVADKSSMRAGVELRVPFLGEKIYNSSKTFSKLILKDICSKAIPKKLLNRKKEGFNPPLVDIVNSKNIEQYIEFFSRTGLFKLLNKGPINAILEDHFSGKADNTYKIWQLVFLGAWLEHWL